MGAHEIILASTSPRRRDLLDRLGLLFEVVDSGITEKLEEQLNPTRAVASLAEQKARTVGEARRGGLVIGADTAILCDDRLLGKPTDLEDARRTLRRLRARTHHVLTGVAVLDAAARQLESSTVVTAVTMADFDEEQLSQYVSSGEPMDKAGAYAIQGKGSVLVEHLEGCYNNVVGLPLCELTRLLVTLASDLPVDPSACRLPSGEPCPNQYSQQS